MAEICEVGYRRLHPEGQLVLADARLNLGINAFLGEQAVEPVDFLDDLPLRALANAFRVPNVMDSLAFGLKENSLELARQKAARPLPRRYGLQPGFAARGQHDESRQVVRLRAQAIEQPRAHAGPAFDDRA